MTKFAGKNFKRTAAMLLCSVSLVLPALAQTGGTNSGAPDRTQRGLLRLQMVVVAAADAWEIQSSGWKECRKSLA